MATGGINLSKEFFEVLKAIGESKSKQEEDRIIAKEVVKLKSKMETPASGAPGSPPGVNPLMTSKKRAKEFLVRLLYVEMLGHDASFGYIKAVEMAASASLFHKRTGYLVCGACLPPTHEFRFMLVNQMQRDLQSANVLEVCGGILACTNLITSDMVPAVSQLVIKLLAHESATVRKKSIVCLHRFHQLAPEVVSEDTMYDKLRLLVCDKDPSVMGGSLNAICAMSQINPTPFKDLVPSLVSILKQVIDHRLPSDFDYHRVPAPWMQLMLIRILGILGQGDASASSGMYEILAATMREADTGINAGYSIIYECIKTVVRIYPNSSLLDSAADSISRFIQSRSHNLKYLGVTGLALIVEQHPQYAAQHQMAVMDCLEDPDETLQRKTLDLLYRMTNPVNVEFISEKLIAFLSGTTDLFLKKVLTTRVCSIAERYAPNNAWYIRTITQLFEVAGDMVEAAVAQNLMSLLAEGTGEDDEEADMLLRQNAVELYVGLLRDKSALGSLPRILLETMAWCLGEYAYLSALQPLDAVLEQLCALARTHKAKLPTQTRRCLITAICKLVAQLGTCPTSAAAVIDDYTRSVDVDIQQRCLEFQRLLTSNAQLLPELFPVDASAEDVGVDPNLSFLDGFVQQALSTGARPYDKPEDDDDDDDDAYVHRLGKTTSTFNMTPYEKPQAPSTVMLAMSGVGSGQRSSEAGISLPPGANTGSTFTNTTAAPMGGIQQQQLGLNTRNVANVWGKGGLSKPAPSPISAPAPAVPVPAAPAAPSTAAWESRSATSGSNPYGASSYGGGFSASAPAPPPVKTAEQLEKERQAAALFGGIIPGAPPPPPSQMSAPVAPPPPPKMTTPVTVPKAPAPAAPVPPPAAAVDLLDLMSWDSAPAPAPVAQMNFDPAPLAPAPAPQAPPMVETVSDDEEESPQITAPASADPFAGAGLLDDIQETPLASLSRTVVFEYNGSPMAPMPITTAQFGQQWGTCSATTPASAQTSKVTTLDHLMELCASIGAHKVEAIPATNEGIAAGMVGGGTHVALLHGKVTPLGGGMAKVDITIKSTDSSIGGSLALYLQTMMH